MNAHLIRQYTDGADAPVWDASLDRLCRERGELTVLRPWLVSGARRLQTWCDEHPTHPARLLVEGGVLELWSRLFADRVAIMARVPFVFELHVAGLRGQLDEAGTDPVARHRCYVARLRTPDALKGFWDAHPLLARRLDLYAHNRLASLFELFERLELDATGLARFLGCTTLPQLTGIDDVGSDPHGGGRIVWALDFADGSRTIYKPRPLDAEVLYADLVEWMAERGGPRLRAAKVRAVDRWGWMEFVESADCADAAQWWRQWGAHLGLVYALCGVDVHRENLIAAVEPVLVDLEGLCHPGRPLGRAPRPLDQGGVLQTAMLPRAILAPEHVTPPDLSAVGDAGSPLKVAGWQNLGSSEARASWVEVPMPPQPNLPTVEGRIVSVMPLEVTQGFREALTWLADHRLELLLHLEQRPSMRTRAIVRPTARYGELGRLALQPTHTQSPAALDGLLGRLEADHPVLEPLAAYERDAVREGDIPRFEARIGHRHAWGASGQLLAEGVFERSGLERVRQRLQQLDADHIERQCWWIGAALEGTTVGPRLETEPRRGSSGPTPEQAVLEVDRRLARLLIDAPVDLHRGRVNHPDGSLGRGLAGVALFLAELARTLRPEAEAEARRVLDLAWNAPPEGAGLFVGGMGLALATTWVGRALQDPGLMERGRRAALGLPLEIEDHDIISGGAGTILALVDLAADAPSPQPLVRRAERVRERLLARAVRGSDGWGFRATAFGDAAVPGMSHGAAGVALALDRLARQQGRADPVSEHVLAPERARFLPAEGNWPRPDHAGEGPCQTTWCHGAPGVALARLERLEDPAARWEARIGLQTTLSRGWLRTDGLCHGNLGNLLIAHETAHALEDPEALAEVEQRFDQLIASTDERPLRCSDGHHLVDTMGLLNGLAGMGLACLTRIDPTTPRILWVCGRRWRTS